MGGAGLEKDKKPYLSAYINIKEGNEAFFQINCCTILMKLVHTYHCRHAMDDYLFSFLYDGNILSDEDTPDDLMMEDGYEIAVMFYIDHEMKAEQSSMKIHVGPWVGSGGIEWDDGSFSTRIQAITLTYRGCIDLICVKNDKNGKPFLADKHGGDGGSHIIQIIIDHPSEYLTKIRGHISPFDHRGTPVICSLVFRSNQSEFGPFGTEEEMLFTFPMEGGMIVDLSG